MLDSNDLSAIAEIVESAIQKSEVRMTKLIQTSIQESETRMTGLIQESEARMTRFIQNSIHESETRTMRQMKKMLYKSESMLLDEMERYDKKNEKRFDKIERQLEGLKDIYRITKNEQETISILLRTMENFEKRLTALEVRTA